MAKKKPKKVKKKRTKRASKAIIVLILAAGIVLIYSYLPFFRKLVENFNSEDRIPFPPAQTVLKPQGPTLDDFVGSEACAECHAEQYELWKTSTHGRAGGRPSAKTVISDFSGTSLRLKDARVTPVISKSGEFKFIVEAQGFPKQEIKVDAMIGGGHMEGGGTQSYFSKLPDGTLRFLPFDFIRQEGLWFCQVRHSNNWIPINKDMSLSDLSQWPPSRILGAESNFSNCQNCHGSEVQVYYDLDKKRYETQYKSLRINCESCHGPGKRHIALAKSGNMQNKTDIGMQSLSTLTKDQSLEVCFQCHAIKDMIEDNYLPGKELEYYYSLKSPILAENPYFEDGRVRAFAYQQNHLFSDCYLNGSMTCVDCHDPHSQKYRDIYGRQLQGKFDNDQCLDCHASKGESPERHSHHKLNSPGTLCTSCHMPYLQQQRVGTRLRFARSDHTIPIPRPQFDSQLGIENACKKCHNDKSIAWLQAKTEEWYGPLKPHKKLIEGLLRAQNISNRKTASEWLLNDSIRHPIAQVTGLIYFIKKFLRPDMKDLEPEIVEKLKGLSKSDDWDLKALALMSLHLACDHRANIHSFLLASLQKLGIEEVPIRTRWAFAADYLGSIYSMKGDFENAIACYKKAIEIKPNDPVPLVNLGLAYSKEGDIEDAIAAYEKAVETKPSYTVAHTRLANLYLQLGDFSNAVTYCKKAIEIKPIDPSAHFLLAKLYVTMGEKQKAIKALEAGIKYAPYNLNAKLILQQLQSR